MSRLLLDSHIWLWYTAGSRDLPAVLRDAIDQAVGACWLSPITLWEVGMLAHKGKVRLRQDAGEWIAQALDRFPLREAPINFEVAREVSELELPQSDPADHFLAATARVFGLTLVTMDGHLALSEEVETLTV
ncbi:MAG: type II toxin-antitoxin system VapC family toxin [Acidobacteriota bacterium]